MKGNCVRSMVQNTVLPQCRGAAFALFNLSDDVGRGLGPLVVATIVMG
jgi:MFS-type transporter involved in bile tolerance (Atg22 family)